VRVARKGSEKGVGGWWGMVVVVVEVERLRDDRDGRRMVFGRCRAEEVVWSVGGVELGGGGVQVDV
jgi:hypothetical protein